MMMAWSETISTVDPVGDVLDLAVVRDHCRADEGGADDTLLSFYLGSAIDLVQAYTGLRLLTQTVQATRHRLESTMPLPFGPVRNLSLSYLNAEGVAQVLDASQFVVVGLGTLRAEIHRIKPYGWPVLADHPAAVTVTAQVGYGDAGASIPAAIRQAILLLVGDYFANREDTIAERSVTPATMPNGVSTLLSNYRIW